MVEVDLRLFVTCRLCLDVQGHFQIDPHVQQQIKYCFDIDVGPFDGLPQLICKKCESILREHYAIKKNFTEKQKELKSKLKENAKKDPKSPPQKHESTSSTKVNNINSSGLEDEDSTSFKDGYDEKDTRKKKRVKKKRKVKRLLSSSDDDLESNDNISETKNSCAKHEQHVSWDVNFNKYFVCRICSEGYQHKENIINHIQKHKILEMKYKNVFKMSCLVVMEKITGDDNMCNNNKLVVYSPDYLIQNTYNPFYYTKYLPKTYSNMNKSLKYITKNDILSSSESSDSEVVNRKRKRLLSRSSSETVVLNRNSDQEDTAHITENKRNSPTVIDLIELGDSSDDGSYASYEKNINSVLLDKGKLDSKSMQNIIKMCVNRYNKKKDSRERNTEKFKGMEDLLQHKLLSIGRKVINNKGFNCTGLLRFLEYKDLSVIWKENSVFKPNNDSKYVRIATRVRGNENSDASDAEWKKYNLFNYECENTNKSKAVLAMLKAFNNFKEKSEEIHGKSREDSINIMKIPHSDLEVNKIDSDNIMLKKLLNKNPVLNPKQLPKKPLNNDINLKPMKVFSAPNTVPIVSGKKSESDGNKMPIVTSTVSLAHLYDKKSNSGESTKKNESLATSNHQQSTFPRIKVKPVSELMPEKPTAMVNGTQNASQITMLVWPSQPTNTSTYSGQGVPAVMGNTQFSLIKPQVWPSQNINLNEQQNSISVNQVTPSKTSDGVVIVKESMVLDTVEFPNTKTTSPFQYFRDLLLVHNITLLDADQQIPAGSITLIKMKLAYQQDKCEPISLCSSLFCSKNIFSIQITDLNHTIVNINNLPANWQWQILKIYNEDITNKILQTAAKISQETYKYTHEFLALLKSIKSNNDDVTVTI